MDYKLINKSIKKYFDKNADITTNTFLPTFPDGLDFDIINSKFGNLLKFANENPTENMDTFSKKTIKNLI